jgi:hypothetical protein
MPAITYRPAPPLLTTVEAFKRQWNILATAEDASAAQIAAATLDDARIVQHIRAASKTIGEACNRHFVPYLATLGHEADPDGWVKLADELLICTSVTLSDIAVETTNYQLLEPHARPYTSLFNPAGWWVGGYPDADALKVLGWWGHHPYPDAMWVSKTTVDVNPAGMLVGATSVVVASVTDLGVFDYIRIEDEMLLITAIDTVTRTLTVTRGERGTTAAAHAHGTSVSYFDVEWDVRHAATIYATYLYDTRDNFGGAVAVTPDGSYPVRKKLPEFVVEALGSAYREEWMTP